MARRVRGLVARVVLLTVAAFLGAFQTKAQTASGQQIFLTCAGCHGLDGAGGEHGPDIATAPDVQRMSDKALALIIRNGIPAGGMPAFGKSLDAEQIQAVLQYLRSLQGAGHAPRSQGDPNLGRALFFGRAGCAECHMVDGRGGFLAADLSAYAAGRAEKTIREAILTPGKDLNPHRGTVTITTRAGKTYRGIIRNEDNFSLQMQTPDGTFHLYGKADLAKVSYERASLMPSDYGSKLTSAEIENLIGFLSQAARGSGARPAEENE